MKPVLILILVAACLAKVNTGVDAHSVVVRQTSTVVQEANKNAMQTIQTIAANLTTMILKANDLIHEYSDNSTNYAEAFQVNIIEEVKSILNTLETSFTDAMATVSASNSSVLACVTSQRNQTQDLAVALIKEMGKCVITKLRQFIDMGITLGNLANETLYFVPNTQRLLDLCQKEPNDFFRLACIGREVASAGIRAAKIGVVASTTVAMGYAMTQTIPADLTLCAQAKLFSFRYTAAQILLTVGICGVGSVVG